MAKRTADFATLSTYEIKMLRLEEVEQAKKEGPKKKQDENVMSDLDPMSQKDVQEYLVLNSTSLVIMQTRILKLKALQKVDKAYYQILQVHGFIKFNELRLLRTLMKECMSHHSTFINKVVKYAAQFCFAQSDFTTIMQWSNMMTVRCEYDWSRAFNSVVLATPENELQILSTQIMLLPIPAPKQVTRVFAAIAKLDKLPVCFELLAKRAFQFNTSLTFKKTDIEPIARKYLDGVYETCATWKQQNKNKPNCGEEAQTMFTSKTLGIANKSFGIIQKSDDNAAQSLLDDPMFRIEKPSELFIEYFLQYLKLGLFAFEKGDKLIAWNYYYDDRCCGYDRRDLFGEVETFQLTENFKWTADFKYVGTITQHPHHVNLILGSKIYGWMIADPEMFDRLMEKYESEDLVQHFAISLSFAGCFQLMIGLFEKYRKRMGSVQGYLCLHLCYMYACAKEGMAKEGLLTWVHVMETAVKNNLLEILKFPPKTFPLPLFVGMKHAGQFACRLLRNCLWTACMNGGTECWKKYGLIILHLCDSLEDSFLNHNMIRVAFQKISLEDMPLLLRPVLARCLRHHYTYWDCIQIAKSRGYKISKKIMKEKLVPSKKKEYKVVPGFLLVYKKLKQLDEMFYDVMDELPKKVFNEVKEAKLEIIGSLPTEKQDVMKNIVEYHKEKARKLERKTQRLQRRESMLRRQMKRSQRSSSPKKFKKTVNQEEGKDSTTSALLDEAATSDGALLEEDTTVIQDEGDDEINVKPVAASVDESSKMDHDGQQVPEGTESTTQPEVKTESIEPCAVIPSEDIKQEPVEMVEQPQEKREEPIVEDAPVVSAPNLDDPISAALDDITPAEKQGEPTTTETPVVSVADSNETIQKEDLQEPVAINPPVESLEKPEEEKEKVLEHKEGEVDTLPVNADFVETEAVEKVATEEVPVATEVAVEEPMDVTQAEEPEKKEDQITTEKVPEIEDEKKEDVPEPMDTN